MQAQRKLIDPARSLSFAAPIEETEGWAPRPSEPGATSQSSPAHLLLLELSARLHQPAPTTVAATMTLPANGKWPMPARLATILGLSIAVWGVIAMAALSIL